MKILPKGSTFVCKNCGKIVQIAENGKHENNKMDRRCVFCCRKCARQFWRKSKSTRQAKAERARLIAEEIS